MRLLVKVQTVAVDPPTMRDHNGVEWDRETDQALHKRGLWKVKGKPSGYCNGLLYENDLMWVLDPFYYGNAGAEFPCRSAQVEIEGAQGEA